MPGEDRAALKGTASRFRQPDEDEVPGCTLARMRHMCRREDQRPSQVPERPDPLVPAAICECEITQRLVQGLPLHCAAAQEVEGGWGGERPGRPGTDQVGQRLGGRPVELIEQGGWREYESDADGQSPTCELHNEFTRIQLNTQTTPTSTTYTEHSMSHTSMSPDQEKEHRRLVLELEQRIEYYDQHIEREKRDGTKEQSAQDSEWDFDGAGLNADHRLGSAGILPVPLLHQRKTSDQDESIGSGGNKTREAYVDRELHRPTLFTPTRKVAPPANEYEEQHNADRTETPQQRRNGKRAQVARIIRGRSSRQNHMAHIGARSHAAKSVPFTGVCATYGKTLL